MKLVLSDRFLSSSDEDGVLRDQMKRRVSFNPYRMKLMIPPEEMCGVQWEIMIRICSTEGECVANETCKLEE